MTSRAVFHASLQRLFCIVPYCTAYGVHQYIVYQIHHTRFYLKFVCPSLMKRGFTLKLVDTLAQPRERVLSSLFASLASRLPYVLSTQLLPTDCISFLLYPRRYFSSQRPNQLFHLHSSNLPVNLKNGRKKSTEFLCFT